MAKRGGFPGGMPGNMMETSEAFNLSHGDAYHITLPYLADEELIKRIVAE